MRKFVVISAALLLAGQVMALDLGKVVKSAADTAKDPKAVAAKAADAGAGKLAAELTKKLKNIQNEKGPIVFATGKADLEADKCNNTLKAIDGLVKQYPGLLVTIEGHTDNKGAAKVNKELSQKRAEAVVKWLVDNLQTPADRMKAKGYGPDKPVASNKTEKGRAKNRRVDFSVTKM
jgi:outer membrane protein OmpA-like peptidoglycan-associated protein